MSDPFNEITRAAQPRRSLGSALRASFLTGLVVIAPIGITAWLVWSVIGWVDSFVLPLVPYRFRPEQYIGINLRGVGVIFFFLFTIVIGWLAKGYIGRSLLRWAESLVAYTPVIRTVYGGLKQIVETVFTQTEKSFDQTCLVEYPRKGIWSIGFISTTAKGEIHSAIRGYEDIVSVFLPTTPNPTSGFLLFVPRQDVRVLDMTVEEAAKLVISAGLVYPAHETDEGEASPAAPERHRHA